MKYITILRQRYFFWSWIYPHHVDIIQIGHITSYLDHTVCHILHCSVIIMDIIFIGHVLHSFVLIVDIICIGHITSYLALNVCYIFQIYSSSVSDWYITYFPVCNLICFSVPSPFFIFGFMSEYKMNTNPIQIYMPHLITSTKSRIYFPHNFRFACCIGVLYNLFLIGTSYHRSIELIPSNIVLQCIS